MPKRPQVWYSSNKNYKIAKSHILKYTIITFSYMTEKFFKFFLQYLQLGKMLIRNYAVLHIC